MKRLIFYSLVSFCVVLLAGCASVQKEISSFWNKLQGTQTEKQGGTRDDAVIKYGYKGQRDEIFIESPVISPSVVKPGDTVNYELQYAVLAPQKNKRFNISETAILRSSSETMELMKKESEKPQGVHVATLQFTIPKDLDAGTYKVVSSISTGKLHKKAEAEFTVEYTTASMSN